MRRRARVSSDSTYESYRPAFGSWTVAISGLLARTLLTDSHSILPDLSAAPIAQMDRKQPPRVGPGPRRRTFSTPALDFGAAGWYYSGAAGGGFRGPFLRWPRVPA